MIKRISPVVALAFLLPVLVSAQDIQTSDDTAIRQTVQYYFDGWKNRDVPMMKKAFHSNAKWLALAQANGNGLREIAVSRVYANLGADAPISVVARIVSIDVSGKAASVKVEVEYPEGILDVPPAGVIDTEYLSLIKFGDGWKIVSKISFPKRTNPPASK